MALLLQLTEQALVHVTWQVAPPPQETLLLRPTVSWQLACSHEKLPLSPAVTVQLLPPLQSALHEPLQVPVQVLPCRHFSEQLPPLAQSPGAT